MERQSLIEEVNLLIEKARSNTELLSDMLVNQASLELGRPESWVLILGVLFGRSLVGLLQDSYSRTFCF